MEQMNRRRFAALLAAGLATPLLPSDVRADVFDDALMAVLEQAGLGHYAEKISAKLPGVFAALVQAGTQYLLTRTFGAGGDTSAATLSALNTINTSLTGLKSSLDQLDRRVSDVGAEIDRQNWNAILVNCQQIATAVDKIENDVRALSFAGEGLTTARQRGDIAAERTGDADVKAYRRALNQDLIYLYDNNTLPQLLNTLHVQIVQSGYLGNLFSLCRYQCVSRISQAYPGTYAEDWSTQNWPQANIFEYEAMRSIVDQYLWVLATIARGVAFHIMAIYAKFSAAGSGVSDGGVERAKLFKQGNGATSPAAADRVDKVRLKFIEALQVLQRVPIEQRSFGRLWRAQVFGAGTYATRLCVPWEVLGHSYGHTVFDPLVAQGLRPELTQPGFAFGETMAWWDVYVSRLTGPANLYQIDNLMASLTGAQNRLAIDVSRRFEDSVYGRALRQLHSDIVTRVRLVNLSGNATLAPRLTGSTRAEWINVADGAYRFDLGNKRQLVADSAAQFVKRIVLDPDGALNPWRPRPGAAFWLDPDALAKIASDFAIRKTYVHKFWNARSSDAFSWPRDMGVQFDLYNYTNGASIDDRSAVEPELLRQVKFQFDSRHVSTSPEDQVTTVCRPLYSFVDEAVIAINRVMMKVGDSNPKGARFEMQRGAFFRVDL